MILNGKTFNPGEMRTRVSIQSRTITADAGGAQVPTWSTVAVVWSRWENAHGLEQVQGGGAQAEQRARVIIRYRAGIDTTCAVLKGSTRYEIISIDNIRERSEYVELIVRRMEVG